MKARPTPEADLPKVRHGWEADVAVPATAGELLGMDVEGISLEAWRALSIEEQNALVPLGRALTFRIGTSTVLGEVNECGGVLFVSLAQIDGGGEGVLLQLWKLVMTWARKRGCSAVRWNVFAATCADPNPRLQQFLRTNGFEEIDDANHGRIFARTTDLARALVKVS